MFLENLLSICLAVVFGAAIGLEREVSGKAAGLRTNILICLGAALFTIISRQMAVGSEQSLTRIAAQIVTGVGFIGAGAIIQDRAGVHGLTTAATIWLVASIGMACGAGFFILALLVTGVSVAVLLGFAPLSKTIIEHRNPEIDSEQEDRKQQNHQKSKDEEILPWFLAKHREKHRPDEDSDDS